MILRKFILFVYLKILKISHKSKFGLYSKKKNYAKNEIKKYGIKL